MEQVEHIPWEHKDHGNFQRPVCHLETEPLEHSNLGAEICREAMDSPHPVIWNETYNQYLAAMSDDDYGIDGMHSVTKARENIYRKHAFKKGHDNNRHVNHPWNINYWAGKARQ
jgi:hypothetical protein